MPEQLYINTEKYKATMSEEDDTISVVDLLMSLSRHKRLLIAATLGGGAIALAIALVLPPIFTSTAKVLPPQQNSSGAAALIGQLGALAGAAGSIAGMKNPADLYIGILESRSVADRLISRFNLKERFESKTMDETRVALAAASQLTSGKKDGLISITVSDEDPKFASNLANAYVEELIHITQTLALTEASQRRLFFEKQLKDAKDQLADAEVALRVTQEKTGMLQPDEQVQAIISTVAQLKGSIAVKEVQLKSLKTFATAQNPEVLRAQEELQGLRAQFAALEKNNGAKDGDLFVPTGRIPTATVAYIRRMREVKYYETMFELLARQFELAKLDEAKDASAIQVLDAAVPAERKSKPTRSLIVVAGMLCGALVGLLAVFVTNAKKFKLNRRV